MGSKAEPCDTPESTRKVKDNFLKREQRKICMINISGTKYYDVTIIQIKFIQLGASWKDG
jgi:hypothetical protein